MPRAQVMGFGFITGYAWLLLTYASDVGAGPGRFKRTEPHEDVSRPWATPLAIACDGRHACPRVQQPKGGDPMSSGTLEMMVASGRGACS